MKAMYLTQDREITVQQTLKRGKKNLVRRRDREDRSVERLWPIQFNFKMTAVSR